MSTAEPRARLRLVRGILAILCLALGGCVSSGLEPLANYLGDQGFTAFVPARSRDGVGTVIDFKAGHESIVASPEPPESQCMTPELVPRSQPSRVAAIDRDYRVSTAGALGLGLAESALEGINLDLGLSSDRVKTISVHLVDPYVVRITRLAAQQYLNGLEEDDPCWALFLDPNNLLIHTVLGARGVEYEFLDDHGSKIALDAQYLSEIGLTGNAQREFEGKTSIRIDQDILIAYRAWKAKEAPGLAGVPVQLDEVPDEELIRRRESTR